MKLIAAILCMSALCSCATTATFTRLPGLSAKSTAREGAQVLELSRAKSRRIEKIAELAARPHATDEDLIKFSEEFEDIVARAVGSDAYMVIGLISGRTEGGSQQQMLTAMTRKAASKGGDLVLLNSLNYRGVTSKRIAPGYSTTTSSGQATADAYGSAYSAGQYTYGSASGVADYSGQSTTVTVPPREYTTTTYYGSASGLVLRYVPSFAGKSAEFKALPMSQKVAAMKRAEQLLGDDDLLVEDAAAMLIEEFLGGPD